MNYLELLSALAGAQAEEDLERRMRETVRVLGEGLPADEVRLYMIQLSVGDYGVRATWARNRSGVDWPFLVALEEAKSRRGRTGAKGEDGIYTAIPILRGLNVPVVIVVKGADSFAYWRGVETALQPLANVQLDRRSARVLEHLNAPLDNRLPEDRFYNDLGESVLNASGMQFAALRLIRGSRLDCVAAWGFDDGPDVSQLSFSSKEFAEFRAAAAGETVAVADLTESGSSLLLEVAGLRNVRAFVALPIRNSGGVFAVLTLATTAKYSFAASEIAAFEALASSVASALSTYRATDSQLSLPELSDLSMRSTIETIAASARHSGLELIDNAVASLGFARKAKQEAERDELLNEVQDDLTSMRYVFEKMKFALKPPRYHWDRADLAELWTTAREPFKARLRLLGIDVQSPKGSHFVWVYPDWIQLVFIQFLINSVDAFAGKGVGLNRPPATGRLIRLEISPLPEERMLRLRYSDNAGGINPRMVRSPRQEDEQLPLAERIFRPEATSKGDEGSGWGLPLVRTAMRQHRGTVSLLDNSRRGVTFDMLLPIHGEEHGEDQRG